MRLPRFPLHFWNNESFRMIGDYLGIKFICYEKSFEFHGCMQVARVLVSLDTILGFLEEMNLKMDDVVHI